MRRLFLALCLLSFLTLVAPVQAAQKICFPQVPDCIEFRFAKYWQDNGGLSVFGLPLTPSQNETVGDQKFKVQYFERGRFELHKDIAAPYDVLLGRLGADRLAAQGRDWQTFPKADPSAPHYFGETGHAIAPQFWGFWSTHGLEFDGNKKAKSQAEAMALFGMPISEPQMEPSSDGQQYLTQWFERAKFEYHPENKPPYDVLLGLLGVDVLRDKQQPAPAPAPTPGQAIGCPENAPAVAEGPQVWVANAQPAAPGTGNSICARLTIGGAPFQGAQVTADAYYADAPRSYGPTTTGADGQARLDFNIDKAKNRFVVAIDVKFKLPDGTVFTAETNFRPRYVLDEPPPLGGPALPNIPPPTGNCVANAPAATEGAQAWMTVYQPADPKQFDSVCARLILGGAPVQGAKVSALSYRYGKDADYHATTDANGVAEMGFAVDDARNRYIVYIDVTITGPDGKHYTATTFYRPNYPNAP